MTPDHLSGFFVLADGKQFVSKTGAFQKEIGRQISQGGDQEHDVVKEEIVKERGKLQAKSAPPVTVENGRNLANHLSEGPGGNGEVGTTQTQGGVSDHQGEEGGQDT